MIKIKNYFKKIFNNNINFIKSEPLLVIFVLSLTIEGILLRFLSVGNFFDLRPVILDFVFVTIVGLLCTVFGKPKRKFKKLIVVSIIFTVICIVNSAYYNWYSSFASISLLASSVNVMGVSDTVKKDVVKLSDFIYLIGPLALILYNKKYKLTSIKKIYKKFYIMISSLIICFVLTIISLLFMESSDWSRFFKLWNRESVVSAFGIYVYQVDDIVQSLEPKFTNIFGYDNAMKKVTDYYKNKDNSVVTNEYTDIFKGKNVIAIHAESFQTLVMGLKFNDEEISPNVNKLASEGIFFDNFYSEVSVGTSSDAEFTYATSLMPSSRGTVFVNYFNNDYITIQKLLKENGYNVYSMHGNVGKFWNRDVMHESMGYDKFYHKDYFDIDETIGLGLSDKSFFRQSINYINEIKNSSDNPYYITMIMLSNHTPFDDLDLMDEYPTTLNVNINGVDVTRDYINNTPLGNYIRSVHYADQAIGEFINNLEANGLLDNTVIVLYGDHDARISKKYYDILYNYDPISDSVLEEGDDGYIDYNQYRYELDRKVPFIIWTKDKKYSTTVSTPVGMIDVLPTLGNMLGIRSDYQLGTDIFNITDGDNTVVFSDGSYLTDKIYYNAENGDIYSIKNDVTSKDYVNERCKHADNLIEVSNYIIAYNLIKEMEEKK